MRRRALTSLLAIGIMVAIATVGVSSRSSATGISEGALVTYSQTVTATEPPAAQFRGNTAGDGWGLAFSATQVFNVFHHKSPFSFDCKVIATASECPGYPVVVRDGTTSFWTPMQATVWYEASSQHLYALAVTTGTRVAGVVCARTNNTVNPFCGFTPLSAPGDGDIRNGTSFISNAIRVGHHVYAFNGWVNSMTGTRNHMLCYDTATHHPCANQPYALINPSVGGLLASHAITDLTSIGNELIVPYRQADRQFHVTCFSALTNARCAGAWPIALPAGAKQSVTPPVPKMNAEGDYVGVCFLGSSMPCVDPEGVHVATPAGLAAAIFHPTIEDFGGPPSVVGARVILAEHNYANWTGNVVMCYDFSTSTECPDYPFTPRNISLVYTNNQMPTAPSCVWLNADGGSSQIQNFDVYTLHACGLVAPRVLLSSLLTPLPDCNAVSYQKLHIVSPTRDAYGDGTVTFENSNGRVLASVAPQSIDANGDVDLTGLGLENEPTFVQLQIKLPGATSKPITVRLSWTGSYHASCVEDNPAVEAVVIPTTTTTEPPTTTTEPETTTSEVTTTTEPETTTSDVTTTTEAATTTSEVATSTTAVTTTTTGLARTGSDTSSLVVAGLLLCGVGGLLLARRRNPSR